MGGWVGRPVSIPTPRLAASRRQMSYIHEYDLPRAIAVLVHVWLFVGVYLGWLQSQMRARVWERFEKKTVSQSSTYFSALLRIGAPALE